MRYRPAEQGFCVRPAGAVGCVLLGLRRPRLLYPDLERPAVFGDAVDGVHEQVLKLCTGWLAPSSTSTRCVEALRYAALEKLQRPGLRQLLDRGTPQGGDPVQPGGAQRLLDPRAGQHAAIADQHHVAQPEALLQLGDLGGHGGRVGGVAFKHLDRNRTTIGGTQQADHQLPPVAATVSAVTVTGQWTTAALEIGGGHVVEHQRAVLEVTACELVFDERLLAAEPVEGGVDFACGDTAEAQCFPQQVGSGFAVEHARGGQFGSRVEQPGDDEPQRQVAAALGRAAGQQVVEADAPGGGQRSEDVAMRQRPADLEAGLADRGQRIATQRGAQGLDAFDRQLGEVGQRAVLDLAVLAIGLRGGRPNSDRSISGISA